MNEIFKLYLSRRQGKNANEQPVFVPANIVYNVLKPNHYDPIRFLYKCYKNKLGGAILNQSDDMNFPVQIAAFLNALKLVLHDGSILVLADNATLGYWYYHLTEHSKWKVKLDIDHSDEPSITLLCHSEEDKIKMLHNHNFSMVFIDDFDKVAKKAIIRKLTGQFKVGLTHRNFVRHPDQRLQWTMLRWSNPKHFGTFDSFCEMDNRDFETFYIPFAEFWQRRTWIFYDYLEKETEEKVQEYTEKVQQWLSARNFPSPKVEKSTRRTKNNAPKRKSSEQENKETRAKIIKKDVQANTNTNEVEEYKNVDTGVGNEMTQENAEVEICDTNNSECEEKLNVELENSVGETTPEKLEVTKAHNSDDILSFLFEDNVSSCKEKVKVEENVAGASSCSNDEKILSPFLFENNSEKCKSEGNAKETSSYYTNEKILSELFD